MGCMAGRRRGHHPGRWSYLFISEKKKFTTSHDIQQRYALFLSTLSYQRLRDIHGGDIDLANEDLDRHL